MISNETYYKLCKKKELSEKEKEQLKVYNKELIKKYPFLLPRNRWTDEVEEDYDYSHTELYGMPYGWLKVFGLQMCEELEKELEKFDYQDKYRITEIKEKYGTLRWYDSGYPKDSRVYEILSKYEDLSMGVCLQCGKPTKYWTGGWIEYLCEDCFNKELSYYKDKSKEEIEKHKSQYLLTWKDIPIRYSYENNTRRKIKSDVEDYLKSIWIKKETKNNLLPDDEM